MIDTFVNCCTPPPSQMTKVAICDRASSLHSNVSSFNVIIRILIKHISRLWVFFFSHLQSDLSCLPVLYLIQPHTIILYDKKPSISLLLCGGNLIFVCCCYCGRRGMWDIDNKYSTIYPFISIICIKVLP